MSPGQKGLVIVLSTFTLADEQNTEFQHSTTSHVGSNRVARTC